MALSNFKFIAKAKVKKMDIKTAISFYQNKVITEAFFLNLLTHYRKSVVKLSLTIKLFLKSFLFSLVDSRT